MILFSTALLNYVAETGSWKAALAGGRLEIYDGAVPLTADAAKAGTLLAVITLNGAAYGDGSANGLNFSMAAVAGLIKGDPAEIWQGEILATGTARYFRWLTGPVDAGGLSTVLRRFQGTCGVSGADMNLPSTAFNLGAIHTVPADQRSFQV